MFNRKIDVSMIDTSSRMAMKMTCLHACKGNVARAAEMYAFLADGISELPDYTPQPPTTMQQLTHHVSRAMSWLRSNKSELADMYALFQQLKQDNAQGSVQSLTQELPPIPTNDATAQS